MRTLSGLFLIAAFGCLLMAGYEYFFVPPAAPLPPFEISQTEFPLGEVPLGSHTFQTTITNPSNEPRRILGSAGQCVANCCVKPLLEEAIFVPPGGSADVQCEVMASRPGPLGAEIKIYLEENGIRTVTLHVTGTAVEVPRAPKP